MGASDLLIVLVLVMLGVGGVGLWREYVATAGPSRLLKPIWNSAPDAMTCFGLGTPGALV